MVLPEFDLSLLISDVTMLESDTLISNVLRLANLSGNCIC